MSNLSGRFICSRTYKQNQQNQLKDSCISSQLFWSQYAPAIGLGKVQLQLELTVQMGFVCSWCIALVQHIWEGKWQIFIYNCGLQDLLLSYPSILQLNDSYNIRGKVQILNIMTSFFIFFSSCSLLSTFNECEQWCL